MSEYPVSAALLRTLGRFGADPRRDGYYASGQGTRAATQAHLKQAATGAVDRVVKAARRTRPMTEERHKDLCRRRRWARGGNMPDKVRECYTEAECAALAVIGDQFKKQGYCALCIDEISRLSGVSRTSVQNAIRKARSKELAHISVRERPQEGGKNLTNIIKVICDLWLGWISRAIGFKRLHPSETADKNSLSFSKWTGRKGLSRKEGASASPSGCNAAEEADDNGQTEITSTPAEDDSASAIRRTDRASVKEGSGSAAYPAQRSGRCWQSALQHQSLEEAAGGGDHPRSSHLPEDRRSLHRQAPGAQQSSS
ncbi:hypothetical protein [Rhizobium sp. BE258]|uniref:hypothetical protein n=1 Tax=Rhizobium sp. BE258 TaxID=2817722 RepID=UPI0028569751|nr:hypothetical protein [Rhizobium sp. BE258]MDR7146158.1 hypothetical protein [Rhizobium sp. BE258]